MRLRLLLGIAIALLAYAGCQQTEQAKVVGLRASFPLSEAVGGEIKSLLYEGALVLEKADGERIEALCDTSLIKEIRGQQMVEVEFDEKLESWKVVKILQ